MSNRQIKAYVLHPAAIDFVEDFSDYWDLTPTKVVEAALGRLRDGKSGVAVYGEYSPNHIHPCCIWSD